MFLFWLQVFWQMFINFAKKKSKISLEAKNDDLVMHALFASTCSLSFYRHFAVDSSQSKFNLVLFS